MVEMPSCSLEVTMSTTSTGGEMEGKESVLQCKELKVCVIHSYLSAIRLCSSRFRRVPGEMPKCSK